MERQVQSYLDEIEQVGGAVAAIEQGFIQKEIQQSAYAYQRAVEASDQVVVGLNKFQQEESPPTNLLKVDPAVRESQITKLEQLKRDRDEKAVATSLENLTRCAQGTDNLMAPILDAVRAYATLGEICDTLREVFGEYKAPSTL
jgi:methylmalonyl-CoA mutase N-terminal domain/subunit